MSVKNPKNIKWGVRQRLEFLEQELFWTGRINRVVLAEKIGISKAQASADIAKYKELAGNNMIYSLSDKTYLAAPRFKPVFISTSPHTFLEGLIGICAEKVFLPFRDIDPMLLRFIHNAVIDETWVKICYQSMSSSQPKERTIAPHSFLSDGSRWHVRAYDESTKSFRDFVLGRIKTAKEKTINTTGEHLWRQHHDVDWVKMVNIELAPHPSLSLEQQASIATDYQMIDGRVLFAVRKACLFYVVARMRLLDESMNPKVQQVVMTNRDEIKGYFK